MELEPFIPEQAKKMAELQAKLDRLNASVGVNHRNEIGRMKMKKRQTKAQKEVAQKAALRQRVADIAFGAGIDEVFEDGYWCYDADALARFADAIDTVFGEQLVTEDYDCRFQTNSIRVIENYGSLEKATERLWGIGVRA